MYRKLHMYACKCLMYRKFLQDTHQTEREGVGVWGLKRFLSFFIYVSLTSGMFFCVTCITNCSLLEKEEVVEVYTGSISPHEQWGRCESSPLLVWGLPSAMLTLFPGRPARTATSLLSNLPTVTRTPDWPRAWGLHGRPGNLSTSQVPTPWGSPDRSDSWDSLLCPTSTLLGHAGRKNTAKPAVSQQHLRFAPRRPGSILSPF